MKTLLSFLVLLFASSAFAQVDKPIIGSLADIAGKTKFYVSAETGDRDKIVKVVGRLGGFTAVDDPEKAEFFIEYKTLHQNQVNAMNLATGEMNVYVERNGRHIIAWSEQTTDGAFNSTVATKLSKKLVKALSK